MRLDNKNKNDFILYSVQLSLTLHLAKDKLKITKPIYLMKKFFILTLMAAMVVAASAQTKKVSILGDSYSTFQGIIPANYSTFYPNNQNDVKEVEQTWWSLYIKA